MAESALSGMPVSDRIIVAEGPMERLITDLVHWQPGLGPQSDRHLADRVLVACGWLRIKRDGEPTQWIAGLAPDLVFEETHYPNPLLRIDDALSIFPPSWMVVEMKLLAQPVVWLVRARNRLTGATLAPMNGCLSVAICCAAVLAWVEERPAGE